jgi:hypothetical protein
VRNVMAVTKITPWPKDVAKESEALQEDLTGLERALAKNDLKAAVEALDTVHEAQHDLSKAYYGWLGTQKPEASLTDVYEKTDTAHYLAAIGLQSTLAFVDGAGFHGMATDLKKATEVNPRYLGTVRNVIAVAKAAVWPQELTNEYAAFAKDLEGLEAALAKNDLQAAIEAAEAVHETQHDLSKACYAWLGAGGH